MESHPQGEPDSSDRLTHTDGDPDPILTGADAVEKTTYVADVHGAGTEATGMRGVEVTASVQSDSAPPIAWIAGVLAMLALVVYGAAMFG